MTNEPIKNLDILPSIPRYENLSISALTHVINYENKNETFVGNIETNKIRRKKRQITSDDQYDVIYLDSNKQPNIGPIYRDPAPNQVKKIYPVKPRNYYADCTSYPTYSPRTFASIPYYIVKPAIVCPSTTQASSYCADDQTTVASCTCKESSSNFRLSTTTVEPTSTEACKSTEITTDKMDCQETTPQIETSQCANQMTSKIDDIEQTTGQSSGCDCFNEKNHKSSCKFYISKAVFNFGGNSRRSKLVSLIKKTMNQVEDLEEYDDSQESCNDDDYDLYDDSEEVTDDTVCETQQNLIDAYEDLSRKINSC